MSSTTESRSIDATDEISQSGRPLVVLNFLYRHPLLSVATLGLVLRLLTILLTNTAFEGRFAQDDTTYSGLAEAQASGNLVTWGALEFELWRATLTFIGPISLIYKVFGPVKWVAQLYPALLGTLVAILVTKLALQIVRPTKALIVGFLIAALPSQVLWSSLLLKDSAVWAFLVALAVVVAAAASSKGRWLLMWGVIAAALLFGLAHLREHTFVVACIALPIGAFFGRRETRWFRVACAGLLSVFIPLVVGVGPAGWSLITDGPSLEDRRILNAQLARSAFVEDHAAEIAEQQAELDRLTAIRELQNSLAEAAVLERAALLELRTQIDEATGQEAETLREQAASLEESLAETEDELASVRDEIAAFGGENSPAIQEASSLDANIGHLPLGLRVMILEPVPWRTSTSSEMTLAKFESIFWYPALALALAGLAAAWKHRSVLAFPLLTGGGMLFVYALTEGNIGTAYRHRGEFVWVIALLAGLGIERLATWWQVRRQPE